MNKLNEKSGRRHKAADRSRRFGAPRAVSDLLPPLTRRALGKHGFSSATLISDWATIIGDDLAASCQPIKLSFPHGKRDSGTLQLRVSSGGALEIQHITPQVIERINGHLGYRAVARLKLIQGPMPRLARKRAPRATERRKLPPTEAKHWEAVDCITDPALRESLQRLGMAIAERESQAKK